MERRILIISTIVIALTLFTGYIIIMRNMKPSVEYIDDSQFEYVAYSDPNSEGDAIPVSAYVVDPNEVEVEMVKYTFEDQEYYDTKYPLTIGDTSPDKLQEFYDERYKDAKKFLNEYADFNFNPDDVIAAMTPKEEETVIPVIDLDNCDNGYYETSEENLSEYFVTRWQPDEYPTDVDPIARARIIYSKNFDPITHSMPDSGYTWVHVTYSDIAEFETLDFTLRPVLFDIAAKPVLYPDQEDNTLEVCLEEYRENKKHDTSESTDKQ